MNVNDVFPSKFLKAADLKGHNVTVTIAAVEMQDIGNPEKPDSKAIVHFENKEKGLVLNKTNAMVIADCYGPETDGWIGQQVILRPDKTNFQGKLTDCIRISMPAPNGNVDEPPF